jgi:hypothetical protein
MVAAMFAFAREARPGAWRRFVLRWGMLLTLIEPDAPAWARQEAFAWLEEERRSAGDERVRHAR